MADFAAGCAAGAGLDCGRAAGEQQGKASPLVSLPDDRRAWAVTRGARQEHDGQPGRGVPLGVQGQPASLALQDVPLALILSPDERQEQAWIQGGRMEQVLLLGGPPERERVGPQVCLLLDVRQVDPDELQVDPGEPHAALSADPDEQQVDPDELQVDPDELQVDPDELQVDPHGLPDVHPVPVRQDEARPLAVLQAGSRARLPTADLDVLPDARLHAVRLHAGPVDEPWEALEPVRAGLH